MNVLPEPRIVEINKKYLIGMNLQMSFADDRTHQLWSAFMPRLAEVEKRLNDEKISMQLYPPAFSFSQFDPQLKFEKWAGAEVTEINKIPDDMNSTVIPGGLYAVFLHKGGPAKGPETYRHIFGSWLPQSEYELDDRPHFEIIGQKYKNNDPNSEEDIYIPIRLKV